MPRPAPDLLRRRQQIIATARELAEAEGWSAVTTRRIASTLGVTQPVIYSVFTGRQALLDAVAMQGFQELAGALEAAELTPLGTMRAYLSFAKERPATYEAMFSLPSTLSFAAEDTPEAMKRAFTAIRTRLPIPDETIAEIAWSTMHGLVTLSAGCRLRADHANDRLESAASMFQHASE